MPYRCRLLAIMALFAGLAIALVGCDSNSGIQAPQDSPATPAPASVTGYAQKGPFQPGGTASAFWLQADGSRKGEVASGEIERNGRFSLAGIDGSGPIELEATGAFFDEFRGNFTMGANAQATLTAAVALSGDAVTNINLFTHFAAARAQTLMTDGTAFADARDQARSELAAIMGLGAAPSTLDTLQDDGNDAHVDDSANLLLFSAAARAGGVNQAGIDALATDFADNGQIDGAGQSAFDAIKQATLDHPNLLATARTNLKNQYSVTPPDDTDGQRPTWAPAPPAGPVAAFTTSGPMQVDASQTFNAGGATGNGLTYTWAFGDDESASGAQTMHVYASADDYTVTLTVTDDANRSDTASRDLSITAVSQPPAPPTAAFSFDGDLTAGASLSFDGRDSTGATLSYAWDFGNGESATGAQPIYSYAQAGTYTIALTVTDRANQTDTATQSLRINATGPAAVFTAAEPAAAGQAQPFDATGSSGNDLTYHWAFGDGDAATNAQVAHVYDSAGDYSVKLTVTDGDGNTDSASQSVTVGAGPQPVAADGAIDGTVTDTGGDPLQGVQVRLVRAQDLVGGARDATTDGDGKVSLNNMPTGVEFVLKLTKDGYGERFVRTTIPAGASDSAAFSATTIEREPAQTLSNAENGGSLTGSDGMAIELPANALVDGSGNPVSGDVEVSLTPVDVGDNGERDAFPGSFAAADESGQDGLLLSFGVAEYQITQNGEELQLAAGKQATLTVPIYIDQYQDGSAVAVGDSIPLWSLDETTGQWIQEGTGTVVASNDSPTGLAFEITAGHLSWYNCDAFTAPYQPIPKLKVSNSSGLPALKPSDIGYLRVYVVGDGPYSGFTTNIKANNSRSIPVPPGMDIMLSATARNGALKGSTIVNGAVGANDDVNIVVNPLGGGTGETVTLPYDDTGAIDPAGEVDRYTFTGQANQVISVEVAQADRSGLKGQMRLRGPSGQLVTNADFTGNRPADTALSGVKLPADGKYTIAIDGTANEPGGYSLIVNQGLEIDQNLEGTVRRGLGTHYSRVFEASAGTVIGLSDAGDDSNDSRLVVEDQDGDVIARTNGEFFPYAVAKLPHDGLYFFTVKHRGTNDTAALDYRTAVARIEPPQPLSLDDAGRAKVTGNIEVYGDHQFYEMPAAGGDGVYARFEGATGTPLASDNPYLRVANIGIGPYYDGNYAGYTPGNGHDDGHLQDIGLTLPGTGTPSTYVVEVTAGRQGDVFGGYQLSLDKAPSQDTVVVDDDLQQCPNADTHSVHAAAYAVTDGGTIDVCSGDYAERLPVTTASGNFSIVGRDQSGVVLSNLGGRRVVNGRFFGYEARYSLDTLTLQTGDSGNAGAANITDVTDVTYAPAPGADPDGEISIEQDGAIVDGLTIESVGLRALDIGGNNVVVRNSTFTNANVRFRNVQDATFKNNKMIASADSRSNNSVRFKGGGFRMVGNTFEDQSTTPGGDYSTSQAIDIEANGSGNSDIVIRGNDIETAGARVTLRIDGPGVNALIEKNRIASTAQKGAQLLFARVTEDSVDDASLTIQNNIFDHLGPRKFSYIDGGGFGIHYADHFSRINVINNTFRVTDQDVSEGHSDFVVFTSVADSPPAKFNVNFINNILKGPDDPDKDGVAVYITPHVTINADNNLFHEFGTVYAGGTTSAGGNDITGMDPLFTNDLLEVESISPAVDAGQGPMTGGPPIPDNDYNDMDRLQGANYDIGAHEQ